MIGKKHINNEEADVSRLEQDKIDLEKKWIKTPAQKREIKVLEKMIELKMDLILILMSWSKEKFGERN